MKKVEARALLAYLLAGFFRDSLEEPSFNLWAKELETMRVRPAKLAAEQAVRHYDRLPSLAEFRSLYRAQVGDEARQQAEEKGLPEPDVVPPPEESLEKLVALGVISKEQADRMRKASAGADNPDEHAARVAATTKRRK